MAMTKNIQLPTDRSFGFTFVVVFALLAGWQAWAGRPVAAAVLAGLGAATLLAALARPSVLHPLNRAWMKFGALLHAIVNPIVLGGMFFVLIAPIGIGMRLFGRDALRRRLDGDAKSYWVRRDPPGPPPDSLPHQF
jgi:hypothetical protein